MIDHAGASDGRSAALKSLNQRRDYGARPKAACISKSTERALREEGRVQQQPSRAASGNELDGLDCEEEEDWADEISAWKPAGLIGQLGRQAQGRPPGITRHIQQQHQWQQQHQQQQQQQLVTAPPADNAQLANASCSHQTLRQTSVARQQNEVSSPLGPHSTSLRADHIAAAAAAADAAAAAQHTGAADGAFDAMHLLGRGQKFCRMSAQPDPPDTGSDACHDNMAALQKTGVGADSQPAMSMQSAITTEQSDYELALRLQAQEHAMHRQHSRPVSGRIGVKQKQRQTSGTLHAFFKQA